jgi:uncharacterized Zn finger protein
MSRRRSNTYDFYFPPSRPRDVEGGIKARSKRGQFVKNWWATRWIEALVKLMNPGRLQRGRSYARRGQVASIEEKKGRILAKVQGSRRSPYKVTIEVEALSDEAWERIIDQLATQAIFTAQLLAGEMPQDIEDVFASAGASLFPDRSADLLTDCNCPDWANPCKHIAAVHYILGERFDEDPFMIFRLRGRTQEQILEALRQRRSGQFDLDEEAFEEEPELVIPLTETLDHFWDLTESLEGISVTIKPPAIAMPLLKRLGEANFVRSAPLQEQLGPVYDAISRKAVEIAFGEETAEAE